MKLGIKYKFWEEALPLISVQEFSGQQSMGQGNPAPELSFGQHMVYLRLGQVAPPRCTLEVGTETFHLVGLQRSAWPPGFGERL